jgi:hypothetical protein
MANTRLRHLVGVCWTGSGRGAMKVNMVVGDSGRNDDFWKTPELDGSA